MSQDRKAAFTSITENCGVAHAHITLQNLGDWLHPSFALHPAFQYLSAVHQHDYLKCYMLHVHGGGYTDIKRTKVNWRPFFSRLAESAAFGIGYEEVGPQGVAHVGGALEEKMKTEYKKLIGMCAMIFRPQTTFTHLWFNRIKNILDLNLDALQRSPARHPFDQKGARFEGGELSNYPIPWTGIGGDILHPLVFEFHQNILHGELAPDFDRYR